MTKVYWDKDQICFLTDRMNTQEHKHWMIQLFLCLKGKLELWVEGEYVSGRCIVVNRNSQHVFRCDEMWHLSILIEPTSSLDRLLIQRMGAKSYCTLDGLELLEIQQLAQKLLTNGDTSYYNDMAEQLYSYFKIKKEEQQYDERIEEVLCLIRECTCDSHSIAGYASKVNLSQSRLVHLFRQQVGVPLKNYLLLHQMKRVFLLLSEGESITQAALKAGFDTPSHFAATTKRMMGISASNSMKDSQFLKVKRENKQ